jgi:hypothetical protein
MKNSGPGFKAAAGIGCTNTKQRVVVGKFIKSTAAADQQHRNESLQYMEVICLASGAPS